MSLLQSYQDLLRQQNQRASSNPLLDLYGPHPQVNPVGLVGASITSTGNSINSPAPEINHTLLLLEEENAIEAI